MMATICWTWPCVNFLSFNPHNYASGWTWLSHFTEEDSEVTQEVFGHRTPVLSWIPDLSSGRCSSSSNQKLPWISPFPPVHSISQSRNMSQVITFHLHPPIASGCVPCTSPLLPTPAISWGSQSWKFPHATSPDNMETHVQKNCGSTKWKWRPLLGSPGKLSEEGASLRVEGEGTGTTF